MYYTKEMGGTLLIVTQDQRTYEVSRHNSGFIIRPGSRYTSTKFRRRNTIFKIIQIK